MRDGPQDIAIKAIDYGVEGLAEPSCALSDRGEHRLNVRRRARNDTQDLACRGLPFQRLLRLVEQPDVLERDDGLVGERLEQGDLVSREATGLAASHPDRSDGHVVTEHRNDHAASEPTDASIGSLALSQPRIDVSIGDI